MNGHWRWKVIQHHASLIFNKFAWSVGQGDSISLRSKFWFKAIGPLPHGFSYVKYVRLMSQGSWDMAKIQAVI